MRSNLIEAIIGAVVLAVAGLFLAFALGQTDIRAEDGYTLRAAFTSTGGLKPGSEVRINGVKVGSVLRQVLDTETYDAVVVMNIDGSIRVPADTEASIAGNGLLGDKYVRLDPGTSEETLPPGGEVRKTKDYRSLEEMIGELIFMTTDDGTGGAGAGAAPMTDMPDW